MHHNESPTTGNPVSSLIILVSVWAFNRLSVIQPSSITLVLTIAASGLVVINNLIQIYKHLKK